MKNIIIFTISFIAFYLLFRILTRRSMSKKFNQEMDEILNSKENKVKSRFD